MGEEWIHIKASGDGIYEGSENLNEWKDDTVIPDYVKEKLADPKKVLVRPLGLDVKLRDILKSFELYHGKTLQYISREGIKSRINHSSFYVEYLDIKSYLPKL